MKKKLFLAVLLFGTAYTVKAQAPIISEVSAVSTPTTDTAPTYVFNSSQAGTIYFSTVCNVISSTTNVVAGVNSINFDIALVPGIRFSPLPDGHYSGKFRVENAENGKSEFLYFPDFDVETGPPTIYEVNPVSAITSDATPNYVFNSSEGGTIIYSGSYSGTTTAVPGNNIITFNTLSPGTYSDCEIKVVDLFGNESNSIDVSEFTITDVPAINSVEGTINDGETITINGSDFRTKTISEPLRYDDFEDGIAGSIIPSNEVWRTDETPALTWSDEVVRVSGKLSAKQSYNTEYRSAGFYLSEPHSSEVTDIIPFGTQELYVSGWFWFKMWGGLSNNTKFINMGVPDTPGLGNNGWQTRIDGYPKSGSGHLYAHLSDDCTSKGTDDKTQYVHDYNANVENVFRPDSAWHRGETYLRIGTNGYRDVYIDGVKIGEIKGGFTSDDTEIEYLLIGHYFDLKGTGSPQAVRYWDELYVDVTQARVEIGDASTWDACSHREIQVPTEWSDGSITFTANQGSFETLVGKYLFVVDADGNASEGKLLASAATGATLVDTHFDNSLTISNNADECIIRQNIYSPSKSSGNTLNIYNISWTLLEQLNENNGEFIWNTSTVHNGIYIMKLVGSQDHPGQKFVLIK